MTVAKPLFFQAVGRVRIRKADIHGLSFAGRARRRVRDMRTGEPHYSEKMSKSAHLLGAGYFAEEIIDRIDHFRQLQAALSGWLLPAGAAFE